MFSKANESINSPTVLNKSTEGVNKAATACTVAACKAPSANSNCVIN